MQKPARALTAAAIAANLVIVTSLVIAATAADAKTRKYTTVRSSAYDGLWSVYIRTQNGPCDTTYRYPARIVGGQIVQAAMDYSYQISGNVTASGAIAVTVSKGLGSATGYGRLSGASGGGRWRTGGNECSGTWSAMRRGGV